MDNSVFQILLVDDQAVTGVLLHRMLKPENDLELTFCIKPEETLATARRIKPAVILLDVYMPIITGIDLLQVIRNDSELGQTPIIMLSSDDKPEVKAKAFSLGANDYLVKLPAPVEMVARLRYHAHFHLTQAQKIKAEEALRQAKIRLESRVEERTRDLQETNKRLKSEIRERKKTAKALVLAKEAAESANQAKSSFLAVMSHEIRTPLNVVLGMLELLREAPLGNKYLEFSNLAHTSCTTLLDLVNDILDFSKIEEGQVSLEEVDFNLRDLLDQAALTFAPMAHNKQIEMTSFFPQEVPAMVRGDPHRLRQIFNNLISNAIKFTPEGGSVEIHGGPMEQSDGRIRFLFEIRDTGVGVPPDKRKLIFSNFTQADGSTTRRFGGTGLGLSISRHLVQLMGGKIHVTDHPFAPSGSVFYFSANLKTSPEPMLEPSFQPILKDVNVLIVASPGLQRALLDNALDVWGTRHRHVEKVSSALAELHLGETQNRPYHLVILNQWPGQDSRSDMTLFNDLSSAPHFILLTDLLDLGWDLVTKLPGKSSCLKKPFNTEQLLTTITWLFQNQQITANSSQPLEAAVSSYSNPLRGRILVVDDNHANRVVTHSMLVSLGLDSKEILMAENGQEAVNVAKSENPDLILMDCQMPLMDGYQATRAIRTHELSLSKAPVPIIAFTADVTAENRATGKAAGMDDFLIKPITKRRLQEPLRRFLPLTPPPPLRPPPTNHEDETTDIPPPLDLSLQAADVIKAFRAIGLMEEDQTEIATLLTSQIPDLLSKMDLDAKSSRFDELRAASHVLKGSMVNTMFPQFKEQTNSLHESIRSQEWQVVPQQLQKLKQLFSPILRALTQL
ncbi:MAG: response regulator [Magnetococcales bacterium]|nr:response regulator [Magnetococcales bacterium]